MKVNYRYDTLEQAYYVYLKECLLYVHLGSMNDLNLNLF
jgi:hypothetical protein